MDLKKVYEYVGTFFVFAATGGFIFVNYSQIDFDYY
jgi:hypothetical protein